jgi:acetylornithine deacetylase/succinyl-diaminopimelate desuccinylase-like protein
LPRKDNAIYHLAGGLTRLAAFDFPVQLFDVTRAYFERMSGVFSGQLASDMGALVQNKDNSGAVSRLSETPLYNALMRTTCVATMLSGGHAENALPQSASATVNCRLLPVDKPEEVQATLVRILADPAIQVSVMTPARPSQFAPMNPKVLEVVTAATGKYWPGLRVIPNMSTGATDAVYLRGAGIPTYGVGGIFTDEDDIRAHGKDERIPVKSFYEALDFMYSVATGLGK